MTDYDLEQLYHLENLSARACNACRSIRLNSLSQILTFYKQHGTFLIIRNAGQKTENDLVALCSKYENGDPIEEEFTPGDEISLFQISKMFSLRNRTKSFLRDNSLDSSHKLISFYQTNQRKAYPYFCITWFGR